MGKTPDATVPWNGLSLNETAGMTPLDPEQHFDPIHITEQDGVRCLHLGGSAVQSAMRLNAPHALELEYTRAMMAFLLFNNRPERVALIGLGGGSLVKFLLRHRPESLLTAVEIDPDVVTAAREWFHLPAAHPRLEILVADGADYVAGHPNSQDVLLVDGYGAESMVPAFATPAFFQACHALLKPGGVAVFNLWGTDPEYPAHLRALAQAFDGHVLQLPAETKVNIVALAFRPPLPDSGFAFLSGRADRLQADLGLEFDDFLVRMGYCNACSDTAFLI